jgi:hypothetical protein
MPLRFRPAFIRAIGCGVTMLRRVATLEAEVTA